MRKIVIDMQNYLFADAVASAFKNSEYDIDVIRAESPQDTVELCQVYAPFALVMEVTGYTPWRLSDCRGRQRRAAALPGAAQHPDLSGAGRGLRAGRQPTTNYARRR